MLALTPPGAGVAAQSAGQAINVRDPIYAPDGSQLAFASDRTGTFHIYVARVDGTNARQVTTTGGGFYYPEFSPDGRRLLAMELAGQAGRIWTMDVDGRNARPVTAAGQYNVDPRWLGDGSEIVFIGKREGPEDVFVMRADGSAVRQLTATPSGETSPVPSPDGQRIVCVTDSAGGLGLRVMNRDGSAARMITSDSSLYHLTPKWSPDGRQIVYYRMDPVAGRNSAEIFVLDVATGVHRQLTTNAFRDQGPAWSPDGRTVVFTTLRDGRMQLYSVDVISLQERPVEVSFAGARPAGSR